MSVPVSASPADARAAAEPVRRFRTPTTCTLGWQYYDERRGEQIIGRAVPKLRLSGRWLEQYGFGVGDRLTVTVGEGRLTLSLPGVSPEAG